MTGILSEAAAEVGMLDLLDSYSEASIQGYLHTCQPKTTDVALQRLQKAEDARAELHKLELSMDKRLFVDLVVRCPSARCGDLASQGPTVAS